MLTAQTMPEAQMDAKVRRWGHSLGVVLPAEMVRQLKIAPGDIVHLKVEHSLRKNNAENLPSWDLAVDYDIDEIFEQETLKKRLEE